MDRKYFTATDLSAYYHFSCQLALWKGFHEGRQQTQKRGSPGSRTLATFSRGAAWEEKLVKTLEDKGLISRFSSTISFEDQVRSDSRNHFFVIDASFKKEELFKDEYVARGQAPVAFGTIKPDFIEIWKRVDEGKLIVEYHIIDAKSSKAVKVYPLTIVLTTDVPSDAGVFLLESTTTNSPLKSIRASPNCIDLVTQRRLPNAVFTSDSEAANRFLSIYNASSNYLKIHGRGTVAFECCLLGLSMATILPPEDY